MKICVVGSGISGLSTAHYLTDRSDVSVTVLEGEAQFGGRANVTDSGEHCTRLFLADYRYLLGLFQEIPGAEGGTVLDSLQRCHRFANRSDGTWVEIDHIYAFLAKTPGLSMRDKVAIARSNWQAILVARRSVQSSNIFGSVWNWSAHSLTRAMASSRSESTTYALPGSTDRWLIDPWLAFLRDRGVEFRADSRVERISRTPGGVEVRTTGGEEHYDAVVFTGFVHDAYALLDRSSVARPMDCRRHTHCKAFTIDLDPREEVLEADSVRIYAGAGITTVVQPAEGRCVTLAAFPKSTEDQYIVDHVTAQLNLAHPPLRVRTRTNLSPSEAVFVGEYVDPRPLEQAFGDRVFFAGSYTRNSYPLDSAEGACRSAFNAVSRLARTDPEVTPRSVLGLPAAEPPPRQVTRTHPNAPALTRVDRALRKAATTITAGWVPLLADVVFDDVSGRSWPLAGPAVYVANHRSIFDVFAGVLAFRHLGVSPRLVIAEKYFHLGAFGKVLHATGALPALRGSDATVTAGAAAIRAGESVAIMPEGRITTPDEAETAEYGRGAAAIALSTGVPIVPIGAIGAHRVWAGSRPWPLVKLRRPEVLIRIGAPIDPAGHDCRQLTDRVREAVRALETGGNSEPRAERRAAA
ncbi:FAD-dependent oxidoreductase [Amycolatopsis sp. FBCC-B4732]|uniref:FAD-dependent oxidoreductase n=1 Tax=Amycolatopsis sp. FBCC-B4732 TaxID=3079339 RepID=UPI001FF2F179|nr:FAD-dependent oxidoreductase [Amycolatopsis sp. FBCC-B4732]UOX85605.1 FAD-dependent oxidoreductase [Amycolatopsis sp. FBCC-B4732]